MKIQQERKKKKSLRGTVNDSKYLLRCLKFLQTICNFIVIKNIQLPPEIRNPDIMNKVIEKQGNNVTEHTKQETILSKRNRYVMKEKMTSPLPDAEPINIYCNIKLQNG